MKRTLLNIYRWIFASPRLRGFNELLFQLSLRGLGIKNYENPRVSGEQLLVDKLLPQMIQGEPPIFLDVGANVGSYTRILHTRFPTSIIHAFEPHPGSYARLASTDIDNVRYHNVALGEESGVMRLYDFSGVNGSSKASLYEEVISEIHGQAAEALEVQVDTLDNFVRMNRIGYIDYLKMDTEGNELRILKGATDALRSKSIGLIHFEFNEMNIISRCFFRDFRRILGGYALFRLLPRGLLPLTNDPLSTELFAYQNVLAVPANKLAFPGKRSSAILPRMETT